jgi:CDP-paratose 2-epimerase
VTVVGLRPVVVTGGAGFVGCNVADRFAAEGRHVLVVDTLARPGVERNLEWLKSRHPRHVSFAREDIRRASAIAEVVADASAVFHFAAQVAVTTSLDSPREDFAVNVEGTLNLLEALRASKGKAPLIFASTNKVYGDLADVALTAETGAWLPEDEALRSTGIGEDRSLDFHTPYGCSKGAADQYVLDYARSFGVPTVVMRMSCIYGPRQMGTEDQGWVAHFLIRALSGEPISIFGDGRQVRDVLYVDDAVGAYLAALKRIGTVAGRAYNLGGGPANAISLRQLLAEIGQLLGREPAVEFFAPRPGDQRYYVSDTRRARAELGLADPVGWRSGVSRLTEWLRGQHDLMAAEGAPRAAEARP